MDPAAALATSCDAGSRSLRPFVHRADPLAGKQARAVEENEKTADAAPAPPQPAKVVPAPPHSSSEPNVASAHAKDDSSKSKRINETNIAKLVAEENESKSKFPRYPGLERWKLLEKMGDGAFSNVYRALDLHGHHGEAAIKVVRKFEMNSMQVSREAGSTALVPTTGVFDRSLFLV